MKTFRPLRVTLAVIVFLTVLVAFLDFRDAVPASLKHAVTSIQFVPSALSLAGGVTVSLACVAVLAVTLLAGRVYCSAICPLGIFQDIVSRISKKLRRKKFMLRYAKAFDGVRYGFLGVTVVMLVVGWGGFALMLLDPYSNFGRIAGTLFRPVLVFANNAVTAVMQAAGFSTGAGVFSHVEVPWFGAGVFLPVLIFFTLVVVMSARRGRLYCNTVCPVGTLLGLLSRRALFRLSIDKDVCKRCCDCMRECKAQCIDLKKQEIDFSRCVGCFNCVAVCEVKGVRYRWLGDHRKKAHAEKTSAPSPSLDRARRGFISSTVTGVLAVTGVLPLLAVVTGKKRNAVFVTSGKRGANLVDLRDDASDGMIDVVAPPGAGDVARFTDQCTACQLCVSACPSHVLEPTLFGYGTVTGLMKPRLNYSKNFCGFNCTVCSEVCPDGAILPVTKEVKQRTRIGVAVVSRSRCIVRTDDTACGACAEHCPTAALQMQQRASAKFPQPFVDPRYCIGCGACEYACPAIPVKAVIVHGLAEHEEAEVLVQEKVTAPTSDGDFPF